MQRLRENLGRILAGFILVASLLVAYLPFRFIPGRFAPLILGGAVLVWGVALAIVVGLKLSDRLAQDRRFRVLVFSSVILLLLVPIASTLIHRVTYARFGLTVYGIFPIPTLDITIGPNGGLWFRRKTHLLTVDEVKPLLRQGVKILIIGDGWDELMRVDQSVRDLPDLTIHILSTPEAFSLFNRLSSEGQKVVLIAHSTC